MGLGEGTSTSVVFPSSSFPIVHGTLYDPTFLSMFQLNGTDSKEEEK